MYGPWAMFISREKKPKSRQIPPTPTMDMLGARCSDPPLPDEFEDLMRSSSDPQMHPQRRWHCFFQAFLTSLRISYDPQAILKCILKGGCIGFPSISDEFEDPQMHPQRLLHCFFQRFLTSLRISYDPQAILKCILKGVYIVFPSISDEFEDPRLGSYIILKD